MLEKIKGPTRWFIGAVIAALVLIWFWKPIIHLFQEILAKAEKLF